MKRNASNNCPTARKRVKNSNRRSFRMPITERAVQEVLYNQDLTNIVTDYIFYNHDDTFNVFSAARYGATEICANNEDRQSVATGACNGGYEHIFNSVDFIGLEWGNDCLYNAIISRSLSMVKTVKQRIHSNRDIVSRDSVSWVRNPLAVACAVCDNPDIVEYLLKNGVWNLVVGMRGACLTDNVKMADILISHGFIYFHAGMSLACENAGFKILKHLTNMGWKCSKYCFDVAAAKSGNKEFIAEVAKICKDTISFNELLIELPDLDTKFASAMMKKMTKMNRNAKLQMTWLNDALMVSATINRRDLVEIFTKGGATNITEAYRAAFSRKNLDICKYFDELK